MSTDKYDLALAAAKIDASKLNQNQKDLLAVLVKEHSPRGREAREALGMKN